MWRLSSRARTYIIVCSTLLISCVGFVRFVFWRSNQISPAFLLASHTAYRSVRECGDKIPEGNPSFVACAERAQDAIAVLQTTAVTQRERLEYANLHGYLGAVEDCHRDWQSVGRSADSKARHAMLVWYRNDLEKFYK